MGKLFVTVFAFAPATQDKSVRLVPGHPHLHAIKSCTLTNFWLRDNFVPDTAQVPIYQISAPGDIPGHL